MELWTSLLSAVPSAAGGRGLAHGMVSFQPQSSGGVMTRTSEQITGVEGLVHCAHGVAPSPCFHGSLNLHPRENN